MFSTERGFLYTVCVQVRLGVMEVYKIWRADSDTDLYVVAPEDCGIFCGEKTRWPAGPKRHAYSFGSPFTYLLTYLLAYSMEQSPS